MPTNHSSGRSSPRLKDIPASESSSSSISDAQFKNIILEMNAKLDSLVETNVTFLDRLETNTQNIHELQVENVKLNSQVKVLNEQVMTLDQYSRKDIVILTGLSYNEAESQYELGRNVVNIVNAITGNTSDPFTLRDFSIIHRNGRKMKGSRPPSITLKFLRFQDKDRLFTNVNSCIRIFVFTTDFAPR